MNIDLATGLIIMSAIISICAILQCTFAIWLYHNDGGTRSTKIILRDGVIALFLPLKSLLNWMSK